MWPQTSQNGASPIISLNCASRALVAAAPAAVVSPPVVKPASNGNGHTNGNGNGNGHHHAEALHVVATAAPVATSALDAQLGSMMGDAPFCDVCGHITVRNGACYKCLNCGNSLGCS